MWLNKLNGGPLGHAALLACTVVQKEDGAWVRLVYSSLHFLCFLLASLCTTVSVGQVISAMKEEAIPASSEGTPAL